MKNEFPNPMIFIPICPRSGSSAVAGIFDLHGAFGGHTNGITNINPKGQFENKKLRHALVQYMISQGVQNGFSNPHRMMKLVAADQMPSLFGIKPRMARILAKQGYTGGAAYFKDDHLMFHYKELMKRAPDAIWVIPRRATESSAASMCAVNLASNYRLALVRSKAFNRCLDLIAENCPNVYQVDTEKMIHEGDRTQIRAAVEAAGLEWNGPAVDRWLDPALYESNEIWSALHE